MMSFGSAANSAMMMRRRLLLIALMVLQVVSVARGLDAKTTELNVAADGAVQQLPMVTEFKTDDEQQNKTQMDPEVERYAALLQWAATHVDHAHSSLQSDMTNALLVIGVKTSVMDGFEARQAIRKTWGEQNSTYALGVRVVFIGCTPDWDQHGRRTADAMRAAIDLEKRVYGDLLTDELTCRDAYAHLVSKVVAFFHWIHKTSPTSAFVMIADDDIYLRVDALVHRLTQDSTPRRRLYAGQVWTEQYQRAVEPQRNPRHKNYLSRDIYPMDQLPPFVNGPHYLLSMDCVAWIARNRADLRGFGALDDVSVGYWLLGLQVHPIHWNDFQNLRDSVCRNNVVSLADLTTTGIQSIHGNLATNKTVCHAFSHATWLKTVSILRKDQPLSLWQTTRTANNQSARFLFEWQPRYDGSTRTLDIVIKTHTVTNGTFNEDLAVHAVYTPSRAPYYVFCDAVAQHLPVTSHESQQSTKEAFCFLHRKALLQFLDGVAVETPPMAPILALALHNLRLRSPGPIVVVAHSPKARFAKILLENLLTGVYPSAVEVVVMDEETLVENYGQHTTPDIFVFSILDGGCGRSWDTDCRAVADTYITRYGDQSRLIMISGEAWETDGLDERVILISTVRDTSHPRHVFIPLASSCFGERMKHSPFALLQPAPRTHHQTRRFCAYLYAQCGRPHREYMFDLLNAVEPVDALGACQGSARAPDFSRLGGRLSPFYNDDAVDLFAQYKFVIAFENAQVPGYITEKLVNAFLAGSIPIYFGDSSSVAEMFNPKSMINCGTFTRLRECAEYVVDVHQTPALYEQMRAEPPIRNRTAFDAAFSWHPEVASNLQAQRLSMLLNES